MALLAAKAEVHAADSDGGTSLWQASQNGHADVVTALLSAQADVNAARETDGVTPLLQASSQGHADVVTAAEARTHPRVS